MLQQNGKILQRETFDVHLDWCIPNTNNGDVTGSNSMVSSSNNIFSRQETGTTTDSQQDQSDSQYILPLVVNRFYPDETSCEEGTNEIDVTELPPAKTRSSCLVDEDLCVTEHPFTSGPYQSLQLYCSMANSFENNSRVGIVADKYCRTCRRLSPEFGFGWPNRLAIFSHRLLAAPVVLQGCRTSGTRSIHADASAIRRAISLAICSAQSCSEQQLGSNNNH